MAMKRTTINDDSLDLSSSLNPIHSSTLTNAQAEKFRQRIEEEYDGLQRSEARYCYYISDQSDVKRARQELERATNGTLSF